MAFAAGDSVTVVPGRKFQDFETGNSGTVLRVDKESQSCQVHFKHLSESLWVAERHLTKCEPKVEDLELFEMSLQGRSWSEAPGALEEAVEASVEATARAWRQARAEAQSACSRVSQLDEKLQKYSREHWLGLDCLQEKVHSMAMSQKDVASLGLQVQSLYEQCEAIKDMVTRLRRELNQKVSHEQLEDLEHQQCKAMESLLQRWGRCTESRRRAVQAELQEVPKTVQSDVSVLSELSKRLEQMEREVSAHRLEEVRQRQSQMDVGHGKATSWEEQRLDALQEHLEALQSGRDQLRLRADALAEGLASEVRLREEGVSRVESQLGCLRNDVEALRGGVEKQLRAMLNTARSSADRKQRDWQQSAECLRQALEGREG